MRRWRVLGFGLALVLGCSSDGQKDQWEEFYKDLRGDNMKMQWDNPATMDRPAAKKTQD